MSDIINVMLIILTILFWGFIARRFIISIYSPVKTVKAEIVDKYKSDIVSKHPGTFKQKRCTIVFMTKNKRLSFDVSEFSYENYRVKQKGTLKYKGYKIISFE